MTGGQLGPFIRGLRRALDPDGAHSPTDAQLLKRYLDAGDESAFELLSWRHGGKVLDVCRRVLHREQDAEDAFQATFLIFVRKAVTIGRRGSVGGWLYKVAYRLALQAKARAARRSAVERQAPARRAADTLAAVVWCDLRPILDEAVNRLPERYRVPFVLCQFEGKSLAEAARQLGCPVATVGTRVARARERLRRHLARHGLGLTAGLLAAGLGHGAASASPPIGLMDATVQAAFRYVAGQSAAAGAASAGAVALAEASLRDGLLARAGLLTATLITASPTAVAGVRGLPAVRVTQELGSPPVLQSRDGRLDRVAGMPDGWSGGSTRGGNYEVGLDHAVRHSGRSSGYVLCRQDGDEGFGCLNQAVRADAYRGGRLRLAGWVKTAGSACAGLWMRVDGEDRVLAFDNMHGRPVEGADDWARHEVVLDVPEDAQTISFGLWMKGAGIVWADDFALEAAGPGVAITDQLPRGVPSHPAAVDPPAEPVNLGFEAGCVAYAPRTINRPIDRVCFWSRESGHGPVLRVRTEAGDGRCYATSADALVLARAADRAWGALQLLSVSLGDANRVLLRFDALAAECLDRAELVLQLGPHGLPPPEPFELAVYELQSAWDEATVTWASQPASGEVPLATATVDPEATEVRIDVTQLARRQVCGEAPGHGWLLKVLKPVDPRPAPSVRA
jgi:RNA polymerase sigma factor (sigma-70 family)